MRPGDNILSINGHPVRDAVDLMFHSADESLSMVVGRRGMRKIIAVEKQADRGLRIVPEEPRWRRCANKCLFCFVDQMPKGLRPSLYVKDEDFRLSFLHGNYLTLTGFSYRDRERVISQKLSPLYVSVHATEERVRRRLLGAPKPVPILPLIRDLTGNGIKLHTQIVLCPGINDGKVLERTINDLAELHPGVASIAVVPVGLTKYRQGLADLKSVDGLLAGKTIEKYRLLQEKLRKRFKRTVLYFSDEFYLLAGLDMPETIWYDDYPQIENGVGMSRLFWDEFRECSLNFPPKLKKEKKIGLVTGNLAEKVLEPVARKLKSIKGLCVEILPVENRLFGSSVTVSGLLSAWDILSALRPMAPFDLYALPENVLNRQNIFIDGISAKTFRSKLVPAKVTFGLQELVKAIGSWAG